MMQVIGSARNTCTLHIWETYLNSKLNISVTKELMLGLHPILVG